MGAKDYVKIRRKVHKPTRAHTPRTVYSRRGTRQVIAEEVEGLLDSCSSCLKECEPKDLLPTIRNGDVDYICRRCDE